MKYVHEVRAFIIWQPLMETNWVFEVRSSLRDRISSHVRVRTQRVRNAVYSYYSYVLSTDTHLYMQDSTQLFGYNHSTPYAVPPFLSLSRVEITGDISFLFHLSLSLQIARERRVPLCVRNPPADTQRPQIRISAPLLCSNAVRVPCVCSHFSVSRSQRLYTVLKEQQQYRYSREQRQNYGYQYTGIIRFLLLFFIKLPISSFRSKVAARCVSFLSFIQRLHCCQTVGSVSTRAFGNILQKKIFKLL